MANSPIPLLSVIIKNRDRIVYEEKAKAVTSTNEKGVFDILPQHSNFISVIRDYIIIHKIDETTQQIPCQEGVLRVSDNVVRIYINVLNKPKKIDVS